ncbi:MAG: hypothetical protein ACODAQ_01895 [Phycisphaeraceae bacterium]
MQCKVCDYRLWNLRSRSCPECGTAFAPSDYEFAPNNVAFCCPHCEQDYYGTDVSGHLVPRTFDCVRCGERIDMDEMVLRPAEELDEAQTRPEVNPWLDRHGKSFFGPLFRTIGASMVSPGRLIRVTPSEGGTAAAFGFAASVAGLVAAVSGLSVLPFLLLPVLFAGPGAGVSAMLLPVLFLLVGTFALPVALLLVWGLVAHGILWLTSKPAGGLGRTYQALCYGHGPAILGAVPCVGFYLASVTWIWWAVSAIFMVKDGQRVGGGRATLAVLTFPGVTVIGMTVLIVMAMLNVQQSVRQMQASMGVQGTASTIAMAMHAQLSSGGMAEHPLEMIVAGQLQPDEVIMMNSGTNIGNVPVDSSTTLEDFAQQSTSQQRALAQSGAANLPPNDEPFRFGDVVFVHRGVDVNQHPGDLWIAIVSPDPTTTSWQSPPREFGVVLLDGTTRTMPHQQFTQALRQENRRRRQLNLSVIPDPTTMQQVGGPVPGMHATPPSPAPVQPAGP